MLMNMTTPVADQSYQPDSEVKMGYSKLLRSYNRSARGQHLGWHAQGVSDISAPRHRHVRSDTRGCSPHTLSC